MRATKSIRITIEIGPLADAMTQSPLMVCVGKYIFGCKSNGDALDIIDRLLVMSPKEILKQEKKKELELELEKQKRIDNFSFGEPGFGASAY